MLVQDCLQQLCSLDCSELFFLFTSSSAWQLICLQCQLQYLICNQDSILAACRMSLSVADVVCSPATFTLLSADASSNTSIMSLALPLWRPAQTLLKPSPPPSKEVKLSNTAAASLLTHLHPFPATTTATRETGGLKTAAQAAPSFKTRCRNLVDKLLSLLGGGHSSTTTASSDATGKACVIFPPVHAAGVRPLAITNTLALLGSCKCHSMGSDCSGCEQLQDDSTLTDGVAVATKDLLLPLKVDFSWLNKHFDVHSLSVLAYLAKAGMCPSLSPSPLSPNSVAAMRAMHTELQCNAPSLTMINSSSTTTIGLFSVVLAAATLGDYLVSIDTLLNHDYGGSSRSCTSLIATNAKDSGACVPALIADDGMNLALIWSLISSFKYSLDSFAAVSDCLRVSGSLNIVWLDSSAFAKALSAVSHTLSLGLDSSLAFVFGSLTLEGPASVAGHGMAEQQSPPDFLLANRSPVALLLRNWCSVPRQHLHKFQVCKPCCAHHCNEHSAC